MAWRGPCLLVVEDDERIAHAFARALVQHSPQVDVQIALTAGDALARIASEPRADAILLDLLLPDAPGESVLDAIEGAGSPPPACW